MPDNSQPRRLPPDDHRLAVDKKIPTYRLWAIISIPFGLVFGAIALMISLDIENLKKRGEFDEAWIKSGRVKVLCIIGNVLTVLAFPAATLAAESLSAPLSRSCQLRSGLAGQVRMKAAEPICRSRTSRHNRAD